MRRFVAVLALAFVGLVWIGLPVGGLVHRVAGINAFVVAALLPAVMNPTRTWAQAFWRCVDLVYAASAVGAAISAHVGHAPRLQAFTAAIVPALVFGTMASLGVGRSGLENAAR